jgi:hypothetical protein
VDFNKIDVICDKYYVRINTYIFIIIKIKYVILYKINDIYNKINFIIKLHIFYNQNTNNVYKNRYKYYQLPLTEGKRDLRIFVPFKLFFFFILILLAFSFTVKYIRNKKLQTDLIESELCSFLTSHGIP